MPTIVTIIHTIIVHELVVTMPCSRPMYIIGPTTSVISTCMHEPSIVA
jgi:hypothetical protein